MTLGADALRGAWSELRLDEHEPAAPFRLRIPRREYRCRSAARKVLQFVRREESLVGVLEVRDERQLFFSGLHRVLRVIVDRAESLIGQVSGAEV